MERLVKWIENFFKKVVNIYFQEKIYELNDGWQAKVEYADKSNCYFIFTNHEKSYDKIPRLPCVFGLRDQLRKRIKLDSNFEFINFTVGYYNDEESTGTKAVFTFEQKKRKGRVI